MTRRFLAGPSLAAAVAMFIAAPSAAVAQQQASTGRVAGTVVDEFNGMTLPTAPVEIVGLDRTAFADLDGEYVIENVPAGTYEVRVTLSGYQERIIRDVVVTPGRTTQLDIVMFLDNLQYSEEVRVRAQEPEANTDAAALLERARSGNIEDNVSGARMRQNSDSDAAQAAERVPGLSVVDNSYVFVRGLGARYSNSTLNGIQMPTTEPDKRVVPLDLFPSGMIDQMQVVKTYTPDKPAEFSGGLVEIESLSFPQDAAFGLGLSFGTDNQLGDPGLNYVGGDRDWLGFNQGYQAYYGDSWEKASVVASYSYKNDYGNWEEQQNVYRVAEGDLSVRNDYDLHFTDNTAKQALVGNFAFRPTLSNRFLVGPLRELRSNRRYLRSVRSRRSRCAGHPNEQRRRRPVAEREPGVPVPHRSEPAPGLQPHAESSAVP